MCGGIDKDARIVAGRIQVKMLHKFFRNALRSPVCNIKKSGTGDNNKKSLGSFKQGYETNSPMDPPRLHGSRYSARCSRWSKR